jgi:hypothetical protein
MTAALLRTTEVQSPDRKFDPRCEPGLTASGCNRTNWGFR